MVLSFFKSYTCMVVALRELNRGSYMSVLVLLNLLNQLVKSDKMRDLPCIYCFFATSLINSIIQEHEC